MAHLAGLRAASPMKLEQERHSGSNGNLSERTKKQHEKNI
jgi:hypothetical protein